MPALVAWIVAGLARLFATRLGQWLVMAIAFLGLEFTTREVVLTPVLNQIKSVSLGLGDALGWFAFFNLDRYITIVLSAMTVASAKGVLLRKRAT